MNKKWGKPRQTASGQRQAVACSGLAGRGQAGSLCKKLSSVFFAQLFPYRSLAFLGQRDCFSLFNACPCVCERERGESIA